MALSDIQERVERSIYEAIRIWLVDNAYLPDISNDGTFPKSGDNLTAPAEAAWLAAMAAVESAKGFASEVFNHSSSHDKGLKRVPRLVIIPRRIMAGDIGLPLGGTISQNPLDPDALLKYQNPPETANLWIDLNLVSKTTQQSRFLNALIAKVIGAKRFLQFYDNPNERFLMKQINYYDLPDPPEGIQENVYSYEVQDLYLFDKGEGSGSPVSMIKEITLQSTLLDYQSKVAADGTIIGPYVNDGNIFIDLSGITLN